MVCSSVVPSAIIVPVLATMRGTDAIAPLFHGPDKRAHDLGVELAPGLFLEALDDHVQRQRVAVRTLAEHGVERVGHSQQARAQRNILAGHAVRVPLAVIPLVMMSDRLGDILDPLDVRQDRGPPAPGAR